MDNLVLFRREAATKPQVFSTLARITKFLHGAQLMNRFKIGIRKCNARLPLRIGERLFFCNFFTGNTSNATTFFISVRILAKCGVKLPSAAVLVTPSSDAVLPTNFKNFLLNQPKNSAAGEKVRPHVTLTENG
jgi:hypothetical protein